MSNRPVATWLGIFRRGRPYPHRGSFILELPWRRLILSAGRLADRLGLSEKSRVLEIGCGSGFYSVEVARRLPRGRLELLDLQPEMLEKTRRKMEKAGLSNVGYTQANAHILPFEDGSFDVVFLVTVLGEIPDRGQFLREALRVLRPKGLLSVSEHLPDPDFHPLTTLRTLVEREGFELVGRYGRSWTYTANFRRPD